MVLIKQDSELMTTYVSANPIPAGQHFEVFQDANMDPAVSSLSEDNCLYLVTVVDGKATRLDFGRASGILPGGGKIQAFAVAQAPDSTLDICIATYRDDTHSNFFLLHNLSADELLGPTPSSKIIPGEYFPTIEHIYMCNKSTATKRVLPAAMIAYQRPDRLVSTEDLRFVQFVNSQAMLLGPWTLATNPKRIIDVVLGTCTLGDGVFVLYESFSGPTHLQFKFFSGSTMVVEPVCPAGATCISSYVDPTSHQSILLVGGPNLTAFKASEYCSPTGKGTAISTGDKVGSLKDLQVTFSGQTLRFWYTTDADAVHYYTADSTALSKGTVIPLLSEGKGGRISSLLSLKSRDGSDQTLVSSLLSVDEYGNLSLLQQDSATQLWNSYPFWYASSQNVMELRGFMLRMHATATDGSKAALIPGCWLRVSASGVVRCIVNGRHATLGTTGQWYQTDAKGVLNIQLQSDDASCVVFSADAYRAAKPGSPETPLQNPDLDPSVKLILKLDGVSTPEDVRALKKKDSTPLVPASALDDDVKGAAAAIKVLVDQTKLRQSQNQQLRKSVRATAGLVVASGGLAAHAVRSLSIVDTAKDWWHNVEDGVEDAVDWSVNWVDDAAGKFVQFFVQIGNEALSFILDTVDVIVKAVVWVFKKLGVLLEEAIAFLGFLFAWDDILATTDSITTGFNASLDFGQNLLNTTEIKIDDWLEELRALLKAQLPALQNNNYASAPVSSKSLNMAAAAETSVATVGADDDDETKSGVAYNMSTYYFTYGGGTANAVLHDDSTPGSAEDNMLKIWDDIQQELDSILELCTNVAEDFLEFFSEGEYNVKALITKISADLIDGIIDSLKILGDILFQAVSLGINLIRTMSNQSIDIPVIGWLWEKIAGDRPLSLLTLVALLIAIPTTVLYKAKAGRAPPQLSGRLNATTFGQYVSGTADPTLSKDVTNFTLATATSLELVYGEFKTISLLVDGAFEGSGLESVPIGPVAELTNLLNATSLAFETVNTFVTWPVDKDPAKPPTEDSTTAKFVKYSKLGLTVSNFGASALASVLAKAKKADQPTVKRWKGTIAAVVAVPTICVALTQDIHEAEEGIVKADLVTNHFFEAFFEFGKQLGFAAASWDDEIENILMYVGLAVKQVCTYGGYGCKIYNFVVGYE